MRRPEIPLAGDGFQSVETSGQPADSRGQWVAARGGTNRNSHLNNREWGKKMKIAVMILAVLLLFSTVSYAQLDCEIMRTNEWNGGFTLNDIVVTNSGNQRIDAWSVHLIFETSVTIEDAWDATLSPNQGHEFTAKGVSHNGSLQASESTEFGVKGTHSGALGEVRCVVDDGAPAPDPDPDPQPDPSPGDHNIRFSMDEFPNGYHDDRSWREWWPPATWVNGGDEGRIFVDGQYHYGSNGKSVRILYPEGKRTSSDSGAQWHIDIQGEYRDLYLSYWVKFDDDFDFVLGGKLPGLSGSVSYTDRTHEWTGRLMWREQGKVEFYMHFAEDRDRWWWDTEGYQATFIPGQWHHVEMHFRLNTPGQYNGLMEGWLDGRKAADYTQVKFREANQASSMITKIFFSTFFGGSSGDRWNARKEEFAWFDEFVVSDQRIGYPGPWFDQN